MSIIPIISRRRRQKVFGPTLACTAWTSESFSVGIVCSWRNIVSGQVTIGLMKNLVDVFSIQVYFL